MFRWISIFFVLLFLAGGGFLFWRIVFAATPPTLNTVTPISACGFNLSFNSSEDASRFKIQTSRNQSFNSPNLIFTATDEDGNQLSGNGNIQAYTTSRLTGFPNNEFYKPATLYYFRVKAVPAGGGADSDWSNIKSSTANILSAPGAPASLHSEGLGDGSKIYLRWEKGAVSPLFDTYGGYEIWRAVSTNGGISYGNFSFVQKVPSRHPDGSDFLDYEDNDNGNWLNPNFSYKYYIKAYQSDRGCADSQSVSSSPSEETIVPVKPSGLTGNAPEANRVILTWNDNSAGEGNEDNFEIWRSFGDNQSWGATPRYVTGPDATTFTDNDVQPNQNYFYKIKACKATGSCSAFSVETGVVTGVVPVEDFKAGIYFVDAAEEKADVYLYWSAESGNTYKTFRKDMATAEEALVCSGFDISECRDLNVPIKKNYEYWLEVSHDDFSADSNKVPINLDVRMLLSGDAWSKANETGGIGWVDFKRSGNSHYSVQADNAGLMSGVAWASGGYGWLSFNKSDLTNCPSGECAAKFLGNSGSLTGWARFLSGQFAESQGWNGWVKLDGVNYVSSTRMFYGAAWGDDVVGWIAFGSPECNGCSVRGDPIGEEAPEENRPPIASNVKIEAGPAELWCAENPYYRIQWDYFDPNNDPQNKAEIEFAPNDFATTSIGTDISLRLYDPLAYLGSNTNYAVKVRVFDGEFWSDWVSSDAITTPSHYLPLVDFKWSPDSIVAGQPVEFTDESADRSNQAYPRENWTFDWRFANATPENATGSTAITAFRLVPSNAILTVNDGSGDSCSLSQRVGGTVNYKRRVFRER